MFNIGDKLTKENYTQGAIWCRKNNATVQKINGEYVIVEIPEPTQEELKRIRISELKTKLAETDYVVIKIAEGEASKMDYVDVLVNRRAWREEIRLLQGE